MGYQPVVNARIFSPIGRVFNLRTAGTLCSTLALTGIATGYPLTPARADDRPITAADQAYYSYYHLDSARAKGYTGAGVTIAIIDGPVDTSVPELAGANITDKSPCSVTSSSAHRSHGTTVASLLVSDAYGTVPDATLLAYQRPDDASFVGADCPMKAGILPTEVSSLINKAIDDGASIINYSASSLSHSDHLKWAIAHAMNEGVLITAGAGNAHEDDNETSLSWWSGVVGVSAIDTDGKFASYSSWGQGVTTTAVGGPIVARDESGQISSTQGTSFSSPIVAGALAQARAKWPNATSNQLLQLLVNTASTPEGGRDIYVGYGPINPGKMLNTDPSQYPDENPLADKGGGSSPTPAEVQQYADGLVDPAQIAYDNSYAYRGLDESQATNKDNPYPTHLGTSPRFHRQ
ncbi:peptidase, S8/S53 family [Actinomyces sp. ICM39]|uniref:S8 family peptidase n=1 Tax=Actinomyces sp. ICM39 TaxID=1105029 RepID=UPI0002770C75|nr:S8/S53 family peptidase [Actinomyces sp. ICM39]EJN45912.1 peptidase, S8/S53 family [Actinomyces sp. ICM39]